MAILFFAMADRMTDASGSGSSLILKNLVKIEVVI